MKHLQAEAEVVPRSLVEIEIEVEVWVEVGVILLFRVGGWVEWDGVEWVEKS